MVMIMSGGHIGFDAVTNIPPPPSTLNYLQQSMDRVRGYLTDTSRSLLDASYNKIAMFDYGRLQQLAQATGRYLNSMWLPNEIQPLLNIAHLQHAPSVMVRWLMAEPTIRTMYHRGEAEGYGENYIDQQPGKVGRHHKDYRIVTDGIYMAEEDGTYQTTQYFVETDFDFNEDTDTLSFIDQSNIMKSWQTMARYANAKGEDPTSQFNASL